jgi:hypothetical protein
LRHCAKSVTNEKYWGVYLGGRLKIIEKEIEWWLWGPREGEMWLFNGCRVSVWPNDNSHFQYYCHSLSVHALFSLFKLYI